MLQPSETELALIKALHRAEFEEIAKAFGEKYEDMKDDQLKFITDRWVPLIRTFVTHEQRLGLAREAALRAMLTQAGVL